MATFSTGERKRRPRGDVKSTEMTIHLKQAMQASIKTELYPYSQIDIFLEVSRIVICASVLCPRGILPLQVGTVPFFETLSLLPKL